MVVDAQIFQENNKLNTNNKDLIKANNDKKKALAELTKGQIKHSNQIKDTNNGRIKSGDVNSRSKDNLIQK